MMRRQSQQKNIPLSAIQWPDFNLPESQSPVKGLTPEQHSAMNEWYLGVKNVVNGHNSKIQSNMTDLHDRISALESKSIAT